ncbi:hypothetical protein Cus16_1926 [Curtobacterium sp. ER1/6]|nr:hypothetical protein Cus16_1926 [Curtobacterium sp. ER1/6]
MMPRRSTPFEILRDIFHISPYGWCWPLESNCMVGSTAERPSRRLTRGRQRTQRTGPLSRVHEGAEALMRGTIGGDAG